jgi:hypothetical protein
MTHQDRFDALARGLATNRLSRGQMVKGIAAVLAGTTMGINVLPRRSSAAVACIGDRVSRPGWNPASGNNGCGSGFFSKQLGKRLASWGFTPACNDHDECYSTCNSVKNQCDDEFLFANVQICNDTTRTGTKERQRCLQAANDGWAAVAQFGGSAYSDGQLEACICCAADEKACNDQCVKTETDSNNCGSCGKVCAAGKTCQAAQCLCPPGKTDCGGSCVDTNADPSYCGSCGNACAAGETCEGGSCKPAEPTICCFAFNSVTGERLVYTNGSVTGGTCGGDGTTGSPMTCTPGGICCGVAVIRDPDTGVPTGCSSTGFGDVGACPPT